MKFHRVFTVSKIEKKNYLKKMVENNIGISAEWPTILYPKFFHYANCRIADPLRPRLNRTRGEIQNKREYSEFGISGCIQVLASCSVQTFCIMHKQSIDTLENRVKIRMGCEIQLIFLSTVSVTLLFRFCWTETCWRSKGLMLMGKLYRLDLPFLLKQESNSYCL